MTDVNVPIQHSSTLFYKNTLRRRKEIGDYWLGRTLGKGSSGRVKLGYHKITGEKVAVKIISKSYLASSTSTERSVKREIAIMKLIQHPHILRLVDVIDLPESSNLYLILEYVQGGELFEYLVQQGRLSEIEARTYFRQIIFGIDYCHRHLICHRDLKPENLLLDDHCNIKIADFGMASLQPSGAFLETSCGSPHYASPEVVAGIPYNGIASDIWSCGVILYALLCGHLPFDDNDIRELLRKVKAGKFDLPSHLSSSAKDFIQRVLVVNPKKRMTMHQLQQHAWFNGPSMSKQPVLPPLPTPDDLARPVCQVSDLDDRLLDTMKTLWADRSTVDLIHALMDNSYNMEKVTYMLLLRHAKTYFAGNDRAVEQQKKKPRPTTICGWNTGQHQPSFSTVTFNSPDPIQQQHMRRTSLADASSSTLRTRTPSPPVERSMGESVGKEELTKLQHQPSPNQEPKRYLPPLNSSPRPLVTTAASPPPPPPARLFQRSQYRRVEPAKADRSPNQRLSSPILLFPPRSNEPANSIDQLLLVYQHQHPPSGTSSLASPHSSPKAGKPSHPLMSHISASLASSPRAATSPKPVNPEPHESWATSWLPSIFHFKRPKMHTLTCSAKDEKEALGKISQIIRERLHGYYVEHMDHDGCVQRHGQISVAALTKGPHAPADRVHHIRFRVEPEQRSTLSLLLSPGRNPYRTMKLSLIQVQGDAQNFATAMRILEESLQDYEHEARLISRVNGWSIA